MQIFHNHRIGQIVCVVSYKIDQQEKWITAVKVLQYKNTKTLQKTWRAIMDPNKYPKIVGNSPTMNILLKHRKRIYFYTILNMFVFNGYLKISLLHRILPVRSPYNQLSLFGLQIGVRATSSCMWCRDRIDWPVSGKVTHTTTCICICIWQKRTQTWYDNCFAKCECAIQSNYSNMQITINIEEMF